MSELHKCLCSVNVAELEPLFATTATGDTVNVL